MTTEENIEYLRQAIKDGEDFCKEYPDYLHASKNTCRGMLTVMMLNGIISVSDWTALYKEIEAMGESK
jgi:hypothetical protein